MTAYRTLPIFLLSNCNCPCTHQTLRYPIYPMEVTLRHHPMEPDRRRPCMVPNHHLSPPQPAHPTWRSLRFLVALGNLRQLLVHLPQAIITRQEFTATTQGKCRLPTFPALRGPCPQYTVQDYISPVTRLCPTVPTVQNHHSKFMAQVQRNRNLLSHHLALPPRTR